MSAQPLRISYIELQDTKDNIDSIEISHDDARHSIPLQGESVFRQNFDQPLTVRGETISLSVVHPRKLWRIGRRQVSEVIKISVRDVLSKHPTPSFRTERNGLVITLGLSSDGVPDVCAQRTRL